MAGTQEYHYDVFISYSHADGPPDHTYKVAYDEAGTLLAQLGEDGG